VDPSQASELLRLAQLVGFLVSLASIVVTITCVGLWVTWIIHTTKPPPTPPRCELPDPLSQALPGGECSLWYTCPAGTRIE
jgi:hypothetical protein